MKKDTIVVGRYTILEEIGKGGFSKVYKAQDVFTKKIVAIKRYKTSDIYNQSQQMKDVEREMTVLKSANHPGIVKVYNMIYEDNSFFLVMEYVEGKNLYKLIKDKGLKKKDVINIGEQILSAMYYLHSIEPPVVYRDLKPSNVIMNDDGKIKLIDFGNSKRYNRDVSAGTKTYGSPHFAAPEQYGNEKGCEIFNTDIRTDIYGVGALLYFLATGRKIDEKLPVLQKFVYYAKYGYGFHKMINKATRMKPDERYQNDVYMLVDFYRALK